jgi:hypothetical protein
MTDNTKAQFSGPVNADARHEFTTALKLWTLGAKLQTAIERAEYRQLDSLHKMLLIRNGLLANLVALCRQNKMMDSRPAILALITYLSDNGDFICTLTIKRIAQIISRSERKVRDSITWLKDNGVIGVNETENGLPNSYWPRISPAMVNAHASVVWFADTFSESPRSVGRPKKTPDVYVQGICDDDVNTPDVYVQGISEKPRTSTNKTPDVYGHSTSLTYFTVEEDIKHIEREADKNYQELAQAASLDERKGSDAFSLREKAHTPFHSGREKALMQHYHLTVVADEKTHSPETKSDKFCQDNNPATEVSDSRETKTAAIIPNVSAVTLGEKLFAVQRSVAAAHPSVTPGTEPSLLDAESIIASDLTAYSRTYDPYVVEHTMSQVLDEMSQKVLQAKTKGAVLSYFHTALTSRLRDAAHAQALAAIDLDRARSAAAASVASEQRIADEKLAREAAFTAKKIGLYDAKVKSNTNSGGHDHYYDGVDCGPAQPPRFSDSQSKVADVHGTWISGMDANAILDAVSGATIEQVRNHLVAATGRPKSEFKASDFEKPATARVIAWVTEKLHVDVAYSREGTPVQICGGVPHRSYHCRSGVPVALSEAFVQSMQEKFPWAFMKDPAEGSMAGAFMMEEKFNALARCSDWADYGAGRQKRIEQNLLQHAENIHQQYIAINPECEKIDCLADQVSPEFIDVARSSLLKDIGDYLRWNADATIDAIRSSLAQKYQDHGSFASACPF